MKIVKWATILIVAWLVIAGSYMTWCYWTMTKPPRIVSLGSITNSNKTGAVFRFSLNGAWFVKFLQDTPQGRTSELTSISYVTNVGNGIVGFSLPDGGIILRPGEGCSYTNGTFEEMHSIGSPVIYSSERPSEVIWRIEVATNVFLQQPVDVILHEQKNIQSPGVHTK
jgi:hypothetical protein